MSQNLALFTLPPGFRGRSAIVVQLWWIVQSVFFHASPQVAYGWRRMLLRLFGAQIGKGVILRPSVRITYPWKVRIGDHSQIGDRVELYSLGEIEIGSHSVVSQDCYICTGGHDPARSDFAIYESPVSIGDGVWLAAGCFVMPGVHVRNGTFAKVRSLLVKDTEESGIYAGSPARWVGNRAELAPLEISPEGRRLDRD